MTSMNREFSPRERQIVEALLEAKQVKDIAISLDLSVNTVKDYLKTIYRKARVHSARELMRQQLEIGEAAAPLAADTALAQLLRACQALEPDGPPREALSRLADAIRRCTRARRVTYWRWIRHGADLALAPEGTQAPVQGLLPASPFLHRLRQEGSARWEPNDGPSASAERFRTLGLNGEVVGALCSVAPRVQVVLASDAPDGRLGPLDAATVRLLVRLAHSAPEQAPLAMRASA